MSEEKTTPDLDATDDCGSVQKIVESSLGNSGESEKTPPSSESLPVPNLASFPISSVIEVEPLDPIWGIEGKLWKEIEAEISRVISLDSVRALTEKLRDILKERRLLLFDDCRDSHDEKFIEVVNQEFEGPLWFVGDLHGDLLALLTAKSYIMNASPESAPHIVFLGDLFDRGKFDKEVLFHALSGICNNPGTCAFVVGNHDDGLFFREGKFGSSVHPCEFAEWLNSEEADVAWKTFAQEAINFFEYAPKAILLPNGLLVAHGGVPHIDRHGQLQQKSDLNDRSVMEDFVWTRLHESAPRKIPNRTTRGCSLAVSDFNLFCEKLSEVLTLPVRGMIRGHDHLEERFAFFEKYKEHPVLTVNAMSYRFDGEIFGDFERPVIVAKYSPEGMPLVHRISVPKDIIGRVYGPIAETSE